MKKDKENKLIFGVCSGIAKELGIEPTIIRLAFIILTLLGIGFPIIIYLILAIIIPTD